MLVDHTGMILFPGVDVFRMIGRLAFPRYAFFIAEGFRYTRSRVKYFLRIFLLGTACQIVYAIAEKKTYIGILLTFSMSIVVMACVDLLKNSLKRDDEIVLNKYGRPFGIVLSALLCAAVIGTAYFICSKVEVDYGFFGVMLPVFVSLFDGKYPRYIMFSLGTLAVCVESGGLFGRFDLNGLMFQIYSVADIPLVLLYNGKRGKYNLKYFFYIFYPAHLAILYLISMII